MGHHIIVSSRVAVGLETTFGKVVEFSQKESRLTDVLHRCRPEVGYCRRRVDVDAAPFEVGTADVVYGRCIALRSGIVVILESLLLVERNILTDAVEVAKIAHCRPIAHIGSTVVVFDGLGHILLQTSVTEFVIKSHFEIAGRNIVVGQQLEVRQRLFLVGFANEVASLVQVAQTVDSIDIAHIGRFLHVCQSLLGVFRALLAQQTIEIEDTQLIQRGGSGRFEVIFFGLLIVGLVADGPGFVDIAQHLLAKGASGLVAIVEGLKLLAGIGDIVISHCQPIVSVGATIGYVSVEGADGFGRLSCVCIHTANADNGIGVAKRECLVVEGNSLRHIVLLLGIKIAQHRGALGIFETVHTHIQPVQRRVAALLLHQSAEADTRHRRTRRALLFVASGVVDDILKVTYRLVKLLIVQIIARQAQAASCIALRGTFLPVRQGLQAVAQSGVGGVHKHLPCLIEGHIVLADDIGNYLLRLALIGGDLGSADEVASGLENPHSGIVPLLCLPNVFPSILGITHYRIKIGKAGIVHQIASL